MISSTTSPSTFRRNPWALNQSKPCPLPGMTAKQASKNLKESSSDGPSLWTHGYQFTFQGAISTDHGRAQGLLWEEWVCSEISFIMIIRKLPQAGSIPQAKRCRVQWADWHSWLMSICHDVYCKAGRFNGITLQRAEKWVAAKERVMDGLICI